uniref:Uncharacterized protein, isoform B n=2 Tax=Drosophila melanogaster TaxID=7227 RepID=M9NFS2_DROME|eukprot:NP_001246741.1 uncharacterized protein Dmel_CG43147, isoform B [Drosophila melanogaster]
MKLQLLVVVLLGLLAVSTAARKKDKKNIEIWIRPKPMGLPPEPY